MADKWVDPRPPVSVEWVGKFKVTIFDQEAYDQSLIDYPPDPPRLHPPKQREYVDFKKKKSPFDFTVKLDRPLAG